MQAQEQPMETDEVYPCKGCGEILEEGKAFELAGNRWHIDCFRCNTCGTLLDSDANLLLLGDGSLICNNCTYSCSACGNKIEDLAILTGDQAFCANCFKCRNCKRKIDNLRYARTSQGIFCMQCHESLMARRRKKNKTMPRTTSAASNGSGPSVVLDKSLPALPPHILPTAAAPQTDIETTGMPEALSSSKRDPAYTNGNREASAPTADQVLHVDTISDAQNLLSSPPDTVASAQEDNFFIHIPVTLDTNDDITPGSRRARANNEQATSKDYFSNPKNAGTRDDFQDLVAGSTRSTSVERRDKRTPLPSPHIVSQQRGRESSNEIADVLRKQRESEGDGGGSLGVSPTNALPFDRNRLSPSYDHPDPLERHNIGLQNLVRARPTASRQESKQSTKSTSPSRDTLGTVAGAKESVESSFANSPTFLDSFDTADASKRKGSLRRRSPISAATLANQYDRPARDDSLLKQSTTRQVVQRKEVPRSPNDDNPIDQTPIIHERRPSATSLLAKQDAQPVPGKSLNRPLAPIISSNLSDGPPARSPLRPGSTKPEDDRDVATPRSGMVAPPPPDQKHRASASMSSIQSEHFSAHDSLNVSEEESGRHNPHGLSEYGGLFRRVSKAMHGRSHSDKLTSSPPPLWVRNGSTEFTSPYLGAAEAKEETTQLRAKLKVAEQKIIDLEAEKLGLQDKLNGSTDLRSMNVELREKRTTMAFLDSQREMVIRELEVMTDHLALAKESKSPLDMQELQSAVLRDFAASLQKLKDSLGGQIDDLMRKKNELNNQISTLTQMKERTYQEYESLSARNAQFSESNTHLVQAQHDPYKQGIAPPPAYSNTQNGLGLYTNNDAKNYLAPIETSDSHSAADVDFDSMSGVSGAKVVDVRKGQPKKFNWKKGGQVVAKGVTKGFKGAFGGAGTSMLREEQFAESIPYGALMPGEAPMTGNAPLRNTNNQSPQWAMLTQKGGPPQIKTNGVAWNQPYSQSIDSPTYVAPESGMFGADLTARCDFEKRIIPSVVSRCIEEVELRGLDLEGIYRKSGSTSQVKSIQLGFEKDHLHYDISDPDLDVHAVTSALKQYFRKLPNPLITYEVYDQLLEAVTGEPGGMSLGMSFSNMVTSGSPKEEEEKARRARDVLETLPRSHRETLEFLIDHLVRVMERESENLMTPLNLAVVFAPTIMRPRSIEREMSDMQAQRAVVQLLLEHAPIVFGVEE